LVTHFGQIISDHFLADSVVQVEQVVLLVLLLVEMVIEVAAVAAEDQHLILLQPARGVLEELVMLVLLQRGKL
jgi:hypothetical protein